MIFVEFTRSITLNGEQLDAGACLWVTPSDYQRVFADVRIVAIGDYKTGEVVSPTMRGIEGLRRSLLRCDVAVGKAELV